MLNQLTMNIGLKSGLTNDKDDDVDFSYKKWVFFDTKLDLNSYHDSDIVSSYKRFDLNDFSWSWSWSHPETWHQGSLVLTENGDFVLDEVKRSYVEQNRKNQNQVF